MFFNILKKDIKLFVLNKSNIIMLLMIPIILILVFGYTLESYMSGDYDTFKNGRVLYYNDNASEAVLEEFSSISEQITDETGVVFDEISDYDSAKSSVDESEAYAVIRISDDSYDYYRSPYNEKEGGSIVRSLFTELADSYGSGRQNIAAEVKLDIEKPDSKPYYTFAGLGLAILLTSYLISGLFNIDKRSGAINRIVISPSSIIGMTMSKVVLGIIAGCIQIAVALAVATVVFGIKWEHNFGLIILVFMVLTLFSAGIGAFAGSVTDNNSASQMIAFMVAGLSGYIGGALTPVYLLEQTFLVKYVIKISPLYWTNKALSNLYNDITDDTVWKCIAVLTALSVLLIVISVMLNRYRFSKGSALAGNK